MDLIKIDGSLGHGGGQILRNSLALSVCLGKGFEITNIRSDRTKPGLRRQHLTSVKACAALCNAEVEGAELDSKNLRFIPHEFQTANFDFAVGTGGSIPLVLQSCLLPAALLAQERMSIVVSGGTYCPGAPSSDFFLDTLLPRLNGIGYRIFANVEKEGFHTAGGGKISVEVDPHSAFEFQDWTKTPKVTECTIQMIANRFRLEKPVQS